MEKRKKTKELSEDLRNQIVRKHEQSQGYKSISKDLNVPVSTVHSVIKKFKAHSTVANLPRCGRKRKIDKRFQRKIVRMLDKEPRLTSNKFKLPCSPRVACGGCHMLVFAVPRPEESELVFSDELKENYLTVNGNREGSTSLQRSPSARKHSPEQIRDLTRTLPPLNNYLLESSLPVPSSTVPPNLLKVRQVSSESSAHDSAAASVNQMKRKVVTL
ncbi:unnamed protein product [Ranitomeya imitator]|uniref:Sleeping Beauty transposase HTH domain-containing protein n=1 Tax=Ranitomeya imitator TaxID=111125 RepID=A0ABN9MRC4_9NEOB|nr:unnamed protein product [Ranitomeya imitator]